MKKLVLVVISLWSIFSYSQEKDTSLSNFFKIEAFIDKISVGYEQPIGNKFVLDVNAGVGGSEVITYDSFAYRLGNFDGVSHYGYFVKGQVKYYISRKNRENKNRSLVNNAGSFIGIQAKYNFNHYSDYFGNAFLTDVHFGQQLPLGKHFMFRYHIGLGHASNTDYENSTMYPAFNLAFGYAF